MEKLETWKMALHQAANLSDYHFNGDGYEYEFIKRIVHFVSTKINHVSLHVADYPVGLESQVLEVKSLLDVGSDDSVHMVGIHGLGGVGKKTLAVAVFNSIADHFEALCFLENVRETSNKHGLPHLQSDLLSETVGEKEIKLTSVKQGIRIIQHRLKHKKVLLIIDDVHKQKQLEAIVGRPDWFGPGSRVIITTGDKQLLACHGVKRICFKFGKSIELWESALNRYKRIPNEEIQEILKVNYDALEEDVQSVFLDIACCFKEYELAEVQDILEAHHGNCIKHHIYWSAG